MVTTQNADSILKSYYLGAVADQLDKSANPFLARIKKSTSDVWGKDVRRVVRYGVNGGVSAGAETGELPAAGSNNYAVFVANLKNLYGAIRISDKAIRASQNSAGAFIDLLNAEMEGLVQSSSYNFGRMLFGDGTGLLATITKLDPDNEHQFFVDSVRNLAEGMVIDLHSSATKVATHTILSVDRDRNVIKLDGDTHATPTNYKIFVQNSKDAELTGLAAIFGTGDLYGVARKSNPWMNPVIKKEAGAITEDVIQETMDKVEANSGSKTNFILCSWDVRRALVKLLSKTRLVDSVVLEGGFRALSYNGIPVVVDRFCPEGTMYLLNTDDFTLHQLCDWQWLEGEDGGVLKQIPGSPVYTATLVKYAELLCSRPAGQAMITGITDPV